MMTIKIRALSEHDKTSWNDLWADYVGEDYSLEVAETTFARLVDPTSKTQEGIVAEDDGILLGFALTIYHAHNWQIEDVCYLEDLYTLPEARGKGVARALVEAVFKIADSKGTPYVYWMTRESNHAAQRLYEKLGEVTPFIRYRRKR